MRPVRTRLVCHFRSEFRQTNNKAVGAQTSLRAKIHQEKKKEMVLSTDERRRLPEQPKTNNNNNNNSEKETQEKEDEKRTCEMDNYPTGSTVPFPFPTPYPQQVALMDALLQGLRNQQKLVLLESPTGTGKSLSLACASMAWLRHTEQQDRSEKTTTTTETTNQKTNNDNDNKDCWWNDWVDPSVERSERLQRNVRHQAHTARTKLDRQLDRIRDKLPPSSCRDGNRPRRENLVRTAVTAAQMAQRQQHK